MIFHDVPHMDVVSLHSGLMKSFHDLKDPNPRVIKQEVFSTSCSKLRNDMVTINGSKEDIGIIVDMDPRLLPHIVIKKCWYSGSYPKEQYRYFLGFNGPDDLAVLWKLSL